MYLHLSVNRININGINSPIKRQKCSDGIKEKPSSQLLEKDVLKPR